jgi:hypothetical protein
LPTTYALTQAHKQGRLSIAIVIASTSLPFILYKLDAFVAGPNDPLAFVSTDASIVAVYEGHFPRGRPPPMTTGDLNATVAQIPTMAELVGNKSWIDIGHRW